MEIVSKFYLSISFVDGIRVVFKKNNILDGFEFARKLKSKGYTVFLQPASVTDYSEIEILELIKMANDFNPHALYIVDTYGLMTKNEVKKYFNIMDNNLNKNIAIGFHSHNNFQLSYGTAIDLLEIDTNRNLIIDSSLFGMGKGSGNLHTELITEYLNKNYEKKYDTLQILEIIDLEISKLKKIYNWGYSLKGFVAASNGCHPKYVDYLISKNTLSIKSVNRILGKIPNEIRTTFVEYVIEQLYLEFQSNEINDEDTYLRLKKELKERKILILATGSSLLKEYNKVKEFINKNNPKIILVNHNRVKGYIVDYLFINNSKRYNQMIEYVETNKDVKIIATSNVTEANRKIDYDLNYRKLLVEGNINIVSDNATLMLINMLINMEIKKVHIAGFDGFSRDWNENYVDNYLSYNSNRNIKEQNELIKESVTKLGNKIEINFITETKYR